MNFVNYPVSFNLIIKSLTHALTNPFLIILFLVIIGDVVTGWAKNNIYHTGNSAAGIKGLMKHTAVFIICLIAGFIGVLLGVKTTVIGANIVIVLFALEYVKSICENLGVMGFKYPKIVAYKVEKEIEEKLKLKEEAEQLNLRR